MILKFRETHIGNMEKGRKGERRALARGEERLAAATADGVAVAEEKQPAIVSAYAYEFTCRMYTNFHTHTHTHTHYRPYCRRKWSSYAIR